MNPPKPRGSSAVTNVTATAATIDASTTTTSPAERSPSAIYIPSNQILNSCRVTLFDAFAVPHCAPVDTVIKLGTTALRRGAECKGDCGDVRGSVRRLTGRPRPTDSQEPSTPYPTVTPADTLATASHPDPTPPTVRQRQFVCLRVPIGTGG